MCEHVMLSISCIAVQGGLMFKVVLLCIVFSLHSHLSNFILFSLSFLSLPSLLSLHYFCIPSLYLTDSSTAPFARLQCRQKQRQKKKRPQKLPVHKVSHSLTLSHSLIHSPLGSIESTVHKYLLERNRPYSINDLFNNLHGSISKPALTKALNSLVAKEEITCKVFGKSTLYVMRQDLYETPSQVQLDEMDNQICELKEQVAYLKDSNKARSSELSTLTSSLTLEDALERISNLRNSNEQATRKLQELESGARRVDPVQKQLVDKSFDVCQKAWRVRKKMCMEIVGMLRESTGQSAAELFEEVGMEKDA